MKVCYWGTYEQDYPRNITLIKGLEMNGVEVVTIADSPWRGIPVKTGLSPLKKLSIILKTGWIQFALFCRGLFVDADCFVVGYPGHFDMVTAKMLSLIRRKPLVFDVFVSLYDSMVFDRKSVKEGSLLAKVRFAADKYTCAMAHLLLIDTPQHADYFAQEFGTDRAMFLPLWVGANSDFFFPVAVEKCARFTVSFHGKFIPLQGVEYILEAAEILKDEAIDFRIVGNGQTYDELRQWADDRGLSNITFYGYLPLAELPRIHQEAHVGLGIFGNTNKAKRVIPNKVYELMAMGLPIITGDTVAIRELLTDRESALLCTMSDGASLAQAILTVKNDEALRTTLAAAGAKVFREHCEREALGGQLKARLEQLCS